MKMYLISQEEIDSIKDCTQSLKIENKEREIINRTIKNVEEGGPVSKKKKTPVGKAIKTGKYVYFGSKVLKKLRKLYDQMKTSDKEDSQDGSDFWEYLEQLYRDYIGWPFD